MRIWLAAVVVTALIGGLPNFGYTSNGIEDIATTVKQIGRGGAFIATEPDAGALMGNPAAMAFLEDPELYLDARLWHSTLDYIGALNGQGQDEDYTIPNVGYVAPVNDRFAWGAGVFTTVNSAFRVTDLDLSLTGAPAGTTDRTSSKVRLVVFTPGLAYKLNEKTSIGGALHYTNGSADFQAYNMLGDTLGYRLGDLSGEGWAARFGIFHRASEDTTLGAYWRSRTHLDIHDGILHMGQLTATPGVDIPGTSVEGFQFPEQYGVGIGQRMGCEWTAYAEYRRLMWDKVSDVVGFVPPAGAPLQIAMNWTNQDVYVLGTEYRPIGKDGTVWRMGLNYAESCVPDSTINPLYPAVNEWHYTAGWESKVSDNLSLVTGAVYAPKVSRTSSAGNPFNALLGLGQPYTLAQESWQFGVGFTWSFGGNGCKPCCGIPDDCACR